MNLLSQNWLGKREISWLNWLGFRHVTYKEIKKEANRFPDMTRDGAFANALAEIFDRRIAAVV